MKDVEIDDFIAGLTYPKFAAYVVNQLVKEFSLARFQAVEIWESHQERICPKTK
jgi:hypothetical protein